MPLTTNSSKLPFNDWKHVFPENVEIPPSQHLQNYVQQSKNVHDLKDGINTFVYEVGEIDLNDYGITNPL